MNCDAKMPGWVRSSRAVISRLPAGRYPVMHTLVRALAGIGLAQAPFVAEHPRLPGVRFVCHLHDSIAREVCYTGWYEPLETQLVRLLLRPGDNFVDVGANWGYFSLLASQVVGPTGRVLAIEPHPRLFDLLVTNLRLSGCANVTPVCVAAAEQRGTLTLHGFDESSENWGVSGLWGDDATDRNFTVAALSLTEMMAEHELDQIRVLKLDVEGAEDGALRGLGPVLQRNAVESLIVELHPASLAKRGLCARDALLPLIEAGYSGWRIDHSRATNRLIAYGASTPIAGCLAPIDDLESEMTAPWPHQLWLSATMTRIEGLRH